MVQQWLSLFSQYTLERSSSRGKRLNPNMEFYAMDGTMMVALSRIFMETKQGIS